MAWWRHSGIARTMAVLLLLWTGADITNSSLCALDQEDLPAASVSAGTAVPVVTALPPVAPVLPHIDDCFCCSHCVEITTPLVRLWSAAASRTLDALLLPEPRLFGLQLYHPPLA